MDRSKYEQDEKKYPWLTILLDTYETSDQLVAEQISRTKNIVCRSGCSSCCLNPTIPFTEIELRGVSWYASEKVVEPERTVLKTRLENYQLTTECPFLIENKCSIYPVRPIICRQFLVRNSPCDSGEDVVLTRPQDIVQLNKLIPKATAMKLLDFWGFKTRLKKERAFEKGFIVEQCRNMHEYDWAQIAKTMELFET